MSADDWAATLVPLFTGLAATQHSMTNPLTTVEGDAATVAMSMQAHHNYDPDDTASWYAVGAAALRARRQPMAPDGRTTDRHLAGGDPAIMELSRATGKRLSS